MCSSSQQQQQQHIQCGVSIPYRVADTPDGDSDTLGLIQAALGDGSVVVGVVTLDIELGYGNLLDAASGESLDGASEGRSLTGVQVSLGADSVDGDARRDPLLDVSDHSVGQLGRGGAVQVVIVDVELRIRVGLAGCLEGDPNEVLAQDLRENGAAQRAVLGENLVADILERGSRRSAPLRKAAHLPPSSGPGS